MYPPKSYILTFHHSHERWRVLLRGSVRFLGRYNHSKCMHWYTRNLKIKSQTHSQIKKKSLKLTQSWGIDVKVCFYRRPPLYSSQTVCALLSAGMTSLAHFMVDFMSVSYSSHYKNSGQCMLDSYLHLWTNCTGKIPLQ